MLGNALTHDRKHADTGREDTERGKAGDTRVCIHIDSGVELFERGEQREPLVVIGRGTPPFAGRRQKCQIVDGHWAGRNMSDRTNGQTRKVGWFVG